MRCCHTGPWPGCPRGRALTRVGAVSAKQVCSPARWLGAYPVVMSACQQDSAEGTSYDRRAQQLALTFVKFY